MMTEVIVDQTFSLYKIVKDLGERLVFSSKEEKNLKIRQVAEALDLARSLHDGQTRKTGEPFTNHIARVASRLTHEYGVTDADVIIAALLHDSVEDAQAELSSRAKLPESRASALSYISGRFGYRVSDLVANLSSPDTRSTVSEDKWRHIYAQHIQKIIEKNPDLLLIKLSDFSDNALSLDEIGDMHERVRLGKKYLPAMRVFLQTINQSKFLNNPTKENMVRRLERVIKETEQLIAHDA